ncbi:MAG: hypothetical protein BWY99_00357 [Synergistetes bacterium ADurb.BinA166]|nr:MAG: hypothetical protein BWY99_00357 [Synergistetes bacterium ADurb.BinA166]
MMGHDWFVLRENPTSNARPSRTWSCRRCTGRFLAFTHAEWQPRSHGTIHPGGDYGPEVKLFCNEMCALLVLESGWGHDWVDGGRPTIIDGYPVDIWICLKCRAHQVHTAGHHPRAGDQTHWRDGLPVIAKNGEFALACDEAQVYHLLRS